ncbi:MAG TPA: LapA family protein [Tissierellaceae bacterium]|nr:LapA family protein [Tissierellaceae bacterium]
MKKVKVNMEFRFIVSLIFAVLVAIFAIQNASSVEVRFFFANITISQAVVILGSAIIGAIIAVLLGLIKQIRQSLKIKQLSKELEGLKSDNNNLQEKIDELSLVKTQESKVEKEETIVEEVVVEDVDDLGADRY